MHPRRLCTWFVIVAIAVALTGCSTTSALLTQCPPQSQGALCIKVIKTGSTGKIVGDVIGRVSYADSAMTGKTSRLLLSRYACDPGSGSQPACTAAIAYPGRAHSGMVRSAYCQDGNGSTATVPPGCYDYEWGDYGTTGDWSGFSLAPNGVTFPAGTWFCISEQIRVGHTWQPVTTTSPLRSCSQAG